MSLITLFVVVSIVVVFHRQLRGAASLVQKLSSLGLQTSEQFFELQWRALAGWLRTEKMPSPLSAVLGVASFCAAFWITYADFQIVQKSISFIWPFRVSGATMAFTIVALQALLGSLFHALRGFIACALLITITLCLIFVQATQSYIRTVEIYNLQRQAVIEHSWAASRPTNRLSIGNRTEPFPEAQHDAARKTPADETQTDSPPAFAAWLAAALATLFACGEVLAFWAAFRLGATALSRCVFAPMLLAVGLPLMACRLLCACRIDVAIEGALFLVCDAGACVQRCVKELVRASSPAERHRRWMARAAAAAERLSKSSELERLHSAADIVRLRRGLWRAEMKIEGRFGLKLRERILKAVMRCVAIRCDGFRREMIQTARRVPPVTGESVVGVHAKDSLGSAEMPAGAMPSVRSRSKISLALGRLRRVFREALMPSRRDEAGSAASAIRKGD